MNPKEGSDQRGLVTHSGLRSTRLPERRSPAPTHTYCKETAHMLNPGEVYYEMAKPGDKLDPSTGSCRI